MNALARSVSRQAKSLFNFSRAAFSKEEEWLDKRTQSNEKFYFTQEDKKNMEKLLEKLKVTSKFTEDSEYLEGEAKQVENILKRYHVKSTSTLIDELVDWKSAKNKSE